MNEGIDPHILLQWKPPGVLLIGDRFLGILREGPAENFPRQGTSFAVPCAQEAGSATQRRHRSKSAGRSGESGEVNVAGKVGSSSSSVLKGLGKISVLSRRMTPGWAVPVAGVRERVRASERPIRWRIPPRVSGRGSRAFRRAEPRASGVGGAGSGGPG